MDRLSHIDKISMAIIKRDSIIMMSDQTKRRLRNEAMHRDIDSISRLINCCFCIPAPFMLNCSPLEFH